MSTTYAERTSTLRLTRRGRIVVFALALIWVLAAFWLFSSGSVATDDPEATQVVMVGTGDTLWDIAADRADDGDVLEMMARIKDLNDLDGRFPPGRPEAARPGLAPPQTSSADSTPAGGPGKTRGEATRAEASPLAAFPPPTVMEV